MCGSQEAAEQVGKDLEVGRWDERQYRDSLPGWAISLNALVTLFIFQPDPGSQGLAEKAGRKCPLPPGTPRGPLSPRLDLA